MASITDLEVEKLQASLAEAQQRVETERALAAAVLPPLPSDAVEIIFSLLPVDNRLRCREVSRAWRAFLQRLRFWRVCNLSGVVKQYASLLHAAAARAGGQLRVLDVSMWKALDKVALTAVAAENAASLTVLRAAGGQSFEPEEVEALLAAAPKLATLLCDVNCVVPDALRLLRNEAPFGAVCVSRLFTYCSAEGERFDAALASAIAGHVSLTSLHIDMPLDDVADLDAVVDLAVSKPLSLLELQYCGLSAASLPSLTRLLATGSLKELTIIGNEENETFLGDDLPTFCVALRSSRLRALSLIAVNLGGSLDAYLALLHALIGHPTLQELNCRMDPPGEELACIAVGHSLALLVTADSPLHTLDVTSCFLGDGGMRPLFRAVAISQRLRTLVCRGNAISIANAHDVVLPAVQANTSLRELTFSTALPFGTALPLNIELIQAEELVRGRGPA